MAKYAYLEMVFPIQCRGYDKAREEVLQKPVSAKVKVYQPPGDEKNISLSVDCVHNTGGHGQRCKASHLDKDKVGKGVGCPYSVDIPYVFDKK